MWKKIGYENICEDYNNVVIEGCLLVLFPPNNRPTTGNVRRY